MVVFIKSASAALFLSVAQGHLDQMRDRLQAELSQRMHLSFPSGRTRRDTHDGHRLFSNHILSEYFLPYGCWCHFDEHKFNVAGKGKGTPVDEWDANCRKLSEGYECAVMDGITRGETCEPWSVPYESAGFGMSEIAVPIHCKFVSNGNLCAEQACLVETFFVNRLANFILAGAPAGFSNLQNVNEDHLHSNGFKSDDCPVVIPRNGANGGLGNGNSAIVFEPKQCCGAYPDRFPFKTMSGDRRCCENAADGAGKTFNPFNAVCCGDGSIGTIGSDC